MAIRVGHAAIHAARGPLIRPGLRREADTWRGLGQARLRDSPAGENQLRFRRLRRFLLPRPAKVACAENRISLFHSSRFGLSSPSRKNIPLSYFRKSCFASSIPARKEGRLANVTTRWAGEAVDARASCAQGVAGRLGRERSTGVQDERRLTNVSIRMRRRMARDAVVCASGGEVRGRRSRVVLAPQGLGAKSCGDRAEPDRAARRDAPEATVANGMVHREERV